MNPARERLQSLFRSSALNYLQSGADQYALPKLVQPSALLVCLGLTMLLAGFLIWSFAGTIFLTVPAYGIILPKGGQVITVSAPEEGTLKEIRVLEGQTVHKGDLLATLYNPETR